MIPRDFITEWRDHAPWVSDRQVEQDLVISRAIVALYAHPTIKSSLAFRGGTVSLKLKVEINSREHFTVYGLRSHRFEVSSRWFSGVADVCTYELDELLGTKLRALYQRKKGRDLFDLALALQRDGVSPDRIVEVFARYMKEEGARVTRAVLEQNLAAKRADRAFTADMTPLLASGHTWSVDAAFDLVSKELLTRLV